MKKRSHKHARRGTGIILPVLLVTLFLSAAYLTFLISQYAGNVAESRRGRETYITGVDMRKAPKIAITDQSEETAEPDILIPVLSVDHETLKRENPDYTGWLDIQDTKISYPVYQGEDNDTYLHHDRFNRYSYPGEIFRDAAADDETKNIILYGHNMRTGTMFAGLKHFLDGSYVSTHPYFTFYPEDGSLEIYQVFSVFTISGYDAEKLFADTELKEDTFHEFLTGLEKRSSLSLIAPPEDTKKIMTLITCYGKSSDDMRLIVQGYLAD